MNREGLCLLSPAKVNLFFRVLGKREDGFHEIFSLYQAISLCDEMEFSLSDRDALICSDPALSCDSSNLVCKALKLFRAKTGFLTPLNIVLNKKIPICSGLGGGSSNAATTLYALNILSGLRLSAEELASWASEFSSDAPFFFSHGTAHCRGRGELYQELPALEKQSMWIYKPKEGLSTAEVFKRWKPQERKQEGFFNELEESAFELLPTLRALKEELLEKGAEKVVMTGSGSALVCFGAKPPLVSVPHFPVQFLNRKPGRWYTFPEEL